jgi:hypothetical protein
MNDFRKETTPEELVQATGAGNHSKNFTPDNMGKGPINAVDSFVNGKSYDYLAKWVMKKTGLTEKRVRKVKNDVDIYDVDL